MKLFYVGSLGNVHTVRWVRYFVERGHEVHVLTPSFHGTPDLPDVKVHKITSFRTGFRPLELLVGSVLLLPMVLRFRRLLRAIRPDVVHVHYINDAALFATLAGVRPLVATAWGSDVLISPKKSRISAWIVRCVLKKADLITCDAEHIREALIQLGADPNKIHRILYGVDIRLFKPKQEDKRLQEALGILDSPTVISVRRLEPLYDIETLVRAMPQVMEIVPRAKLVLLGAGSQEAKLRALAKSLGISNSIRFVGRVPADEVPRYLTAAHICVSTALSDGGPGGIMEAMACELPVITTDFGENREWVEDGVNGFIIPQKSPQVLASRIIHLMQNREAGGKMGKINRQIIVERNNWEKEMGKMGKLYEELITRQK